MRRTLGIIPTLLFASLCFAAQQDRIAGTIETYPAVVLEGSVYAKAQPQFDQGPVEPSFKLACITMVMQPSAKQQADLQQLLKQQQDPSSPNYHKWLTPEQYADRFGLSSNDVEKLTVWLQSQGFSIVQVARGRNWIAFSGTAALVENTFHTQIHYFEVDGERHFANATEISIPQALAGMVVGFRGLTDFGPRPMGIRELGRTEFFPMIARPSYDLGGSHFLAPGDIATIYNMTPLYNSTPPIDGTGMKMVIVGQVDVSTSLSDIDNFRSAFGLAKNDPQETIVPGSPNPGTNSGDMGESKLDLEWAGAVARNATILFITADTSVGGVFDAAQYAIDNSLAPVISMSYGGCESLNVSFIPSNEPIMQQANTEGITFMASSGDEGAAACDASSAMVAVGGLAVNYPASSPEVTGVGGNEFNEGSGNYWGGTNGNNGGSAISYIPEMGWNDTPLGFGLAASGGGASSCGQSSGTTCTGGFPKPSWQTGTGVPNDGVRDVPDVSMTASADHDGYIICDSGSCASGIGANPMIVGGTSASTPVFAGIVTLMNQLLGGTGLGNINTRLYQLAQNTSNGVFHDVTTGNNIVPCTPGTPSGFPASLQCPKSGSFGYTAGVGYDQVTGLGSVNADALATSFSGAATTTTVTSSSNPANSGVAVTFTATVTTTGATTPTGKVTFNDGATALGTGTLNSSGVATF
ncbi:MAG TPA: S53 family peptidase, partial [Terriglobales bacterium]|nr:S53 family peptidase [Terriglobales bacterium]